MGVGNPRRVERQSNYRIERSRGGSINQTRRNHSPCTARGIPARKQLWPHLSSIYPPIYPSILVSFFLFCLTLISCWVVALRPSASRRSRDFRPDDSARAARRGPQQIYPLAAIDKWFDRNLLYIGKSCINHFLGSSAYLNELMNGIDEHILDLTAKSV